MSAGEPHVSSRRAERDWETLARAASATAAGGQEEPELLRELLCFRLGDSPYAVPVERVREIVRARSVTPMPRVPDFVLGVISLRGEIVQVLDLRMRLSLEAKPRTKASRIIVLHGEDDRVTGVLVDAVNDVLRVTEEAFRPAAAGDGAAVVELCTRGEEFISVIDLERVLDVDART